MAEDVDLAEADAQDHAVPQRSGRARIVLKWAAIALAGLALLVAALIFGLNTSAGKRLISDQIAGLESESGISMSIGRIEGSIYGAMVLHDVSLSDPKGVFLTSPRVELDWNPAAYLGSHIDIHSLNSRVVRLQRIPELNETDPDDPLLPDIDIDIGSFTIERFVVEPQVTGERQVAIMSGNARIADGRAQLEFDGRTIGGSSDEGGDRLALVLDAVPEENRLKLDLELVAPSGGVIAAIAGINEELGIRVAGGGDWAKWDGALTARSGAQQIAQLALTARDGTLGVKGPARLASLFEGPTAALLGPEMTVDIEAQAEGRRLDLAGSLTSAAMRVNTNGIADLGESQFEELNASFVLLRPSALAQNLRGSGLRGRIVLDGAFAAPTVQYQLNANRLILDEMGIENLRAEGEARIDADRIQIPVSASVARITGLDTVAGGALENIRLTGDLAIDGPRILSDNMRIRSDRIDATLILAADMSSGIYTGAIDGRIDNYRIESVGIFDITTDLDLETERDGFALAGRIGVRSRQLTNESVREFLGGPAVAGADVRYRSDGSITFRNLRLRAPLVTVTGGSGSYSPSGQIALIADADSSRYGPIGIRVAGTIADPRATITAERPGFGIGLANFETAITAAAGGYRLNARGDTDYGPLIADIILGSGEVATMEISSANLGGIDFSGSLRQTPAGPFAGRLVASGNGVDGIATLGAAGPHQEALINLRARNAALGGPAQLRIGSAIVDARVVLRDTPTVAADIQLAGARLWGLTVAAARARIDYQDGNGTARILAEGRSGAPFRVAGNVQMTPDLWRAAIDGRMRGISFKTVKPARIVPRDGEYELLPTTIDIGRGSVRLAGQYGTGLKIQSRLDSVDLEVVNAFMPGLGINGRASGSLDFAQETLTAFPRADARLTIKNFTRTTAVSVSQATDINVVGKLLASGGDARAVFRRRGSVIGRMQASLSPLPPGSGPWLTRLLEAPLRGGVRYNGPADTLFSLAGQPDQRLSGPIGIAADFSCRVSRPCLDGIVRANKLTYENQTYGTRLSDMKVEGRFSGERLEIEQLTAAAGDGSIAATGYVSLASDDGYPMDLRVTLDDARLARSETLDATATGELRLSKSAGADALLSGAILLPDTHYEIVREGAAQVPELSGVRFKPPKGPQRITGDEPADVVPGIFSRLRLDIALEAPNQLSVSGMGLESEWSADFRVTGTSSDPRLSGEVSLIRGSLGFAGRRFELSEGRINFTGGREVNPSILLVATEDIDEIQVNVNVSGRALNPQVNFTSSPGLPQDEIISRILFGSSVENLSAIQAVQLASSLNSLRSSGGGLNPLGKLRSATGIDRLRILGPDEANGRGTALAAGQYLTDDVYIELVTDARGFTATQIEVSLTPALSVLSRAGGSNGTDVNVRYRINY
ncbi:translocation/assembly module TamB domain-containing protein [Altererythrobacter sp. MF3-039]|uniref:translocation/assembly module TamB domain-containing protein n=1 Tax=Altererythrobacter sp. MF3-039 TaxID=3252901 RepID=UPI00390C61C1